VPGFEEVTARGAYHDFLTLWNDADPDIPIPHRRESRIRKTEMILKGFITLSGSALDALKGCYSAGR
jgi:hypothetical protein